jgi:hypothetical protein
MSVRLLVRPSVRPSMHASIICTYPTSFFSLNMLQHYGAQNDPEVLRRQARMQQKARRQPPKPLDTGPNKQNNSFFFTQYVMSGRGQDTSRLEDPREALLKMDELAKQDPVYLGKAYEHTQPKTKFAALTYEQEKEEFTKKQKKFF